jgi:hypothetical protein
MRGLLVEKGLISLPYIAIVMGKGGMTDDYAVVVTFFTAWACGPLGP